MILALKAYLPNETAPVITFTPNLRCIIFKGTAVSSNIFLIVNAESVTKSGIFNKANVL